MRTQVTLLILILGGIIGGMIFWKGMSTDSRISPISEITPEIKKETSKNLLETSPETSTHKNKDSLKNSSQPKAQLRTTFEKSKFHWDLFKKKFGKNLKAEFAPSGQLISIKGSFGEGSSASPKFHPEDPLQSITRAKAVIEGITPLIGISPDWPLGDAVAKGSPYSAQIYFTQTHQGLLIAPGGTIKVDLGKHGEIISVYSNYAPNVKVVNQSRLNSDEARARVIAEYSSESTKAPRVEGGTQIIWVEGTQGRYAYQFLAQGHVVIVDAETGKILSNWDRRNY